MFGLYFLLSVFFPLSVEPAHASLANKPATVEVHFEDGRPIAVGTPIIVDGRLFSEVSEVTPAGVTADRTVVKFEIPAEKRHALHPESVAVYTSLLSEISVSTDKVIQLLSPPKKAPPAITDGSALKGYHSFEDFWRG